MRFLSVCSGIEAASVAWSPLGWKAQAFSEIEPFPCSVLAHHYPDVPNLGDMTRFSEWPDATVDLLCGGTPCQSFSVAGLRKGLDDPRGNLMLTFGAIAARYRPTWLVWENVPGVLSSNGGRDFGAFLGMLGQLGYGFAYRVLDAQFFGVAQRRRRVFVVGCLGDWRRAAAVLFERHSVSGHPAPSREAGQGTAGRAARRSFALGSHAGAADGDQTNRSHASGGPVGSNISEECAYSLRAGRMQSVAHAVTGEGFDASEDGTERGTPLVPVMSQEARNGDTFSGCVAFDTTQITSAANYSSPKAGDPCHPLAAGMHAPAIAFDCKAGQHFTAAEDHAPTLRSMNGLQPNGGGQLAALTGAAVRRLTPRECERLQGFPDDYTLVPHRGKPAADGPRYKALGNSWAVPCAAWIGRRIEAVEAIAQLEAA